MTRLPREGSMHAAMRPARISLIVTALLLGRACGGPGATQVTSSSTAGVTTSSTTTSLNPATTAAPRTTTMPTSATTTAPPASPWQVAGRRYYFPVQPPDSATYSSTHHDYPATDIYAPGGTTVVAVTDGVIHEVSRTDSWDPDVDDGATRAGLFVTILGTDGIRYHVSHLDIVEPGIEPGRPVRAGEPIGTVGMTGNARSPHVHFGISRPGGPGDWEVRRGEVWPYEYLQAWTDGQDLTPVLPDG